jgi:hypothetical protein
VSARSGTPNVCSACRGRSVGAVLHHDR